MRFVHPLFAYVKIAGFVVLETSLAVLICVSLGAVFAGAQDMYRNGQPPEPKAEAGRELM